MAIVCRAPLGAGELIKGWEGIKAGAEPHQVMGRAADREGVLLAQLLQHHPDIAADFALQVVTAVWGGVLLVLAMAVGDAPARLLSLWDRHQIGSDSLSAPLGADSLSAPLGVTLPGPCWAAGSAVLTSSCSKRSMKAAWRCWVMRSVIVRAVRGTWKWSRKAIEKRFQASLSLRAIALSIAVSVLI
jgi:hypothetical protein